MNNSLVANDDYLYRSIYRTPWHNPAHAYIWGMEEADDLMPALLAQKSVVILR